MDDQYYILLEEISHPEEIAGVRVILLTKDREKAVMSAKEIMEEDVYGSFGSYTNHVNADVVEAWGDVCITLRIVKRQLDQLCP